MTHGPWSFTAILNRLARKLIVFYHLMCKGHNGSGPYTDMATAWKTWDFILVGAKHFSFLHKPPVHPCSPPSPLMIGYHIPCTDGKAAGTWSSPLRFRMSGVILLLLFCASCHGEGQILLLRAMIFNTPVLTSSIQSSTSVEGETVMSWSPVTPCTVDSRLIFAAIPLLATTLKTKLYYLGAADRRRWIILINGNLYNFKL